MADTAGTKKRPGVLGVHSIDHFAFQVSDLGEARNFYTLFGLDVRDENGGLGLYTKGHKHRWGRITKGSGSKKLSYVSFGIFAEDEKAFDAHLTSAGLKRIAPADNTDPAGIWFEGYDGLPINVRVAEKSSPDEKSHFEAPSALPGVSGAIFNSKAPRVYPRRLSHFAVFATDVPAAIKFYEKALGLRLSDKSGPAVAFLHGVHGSDHHMFALVMSDRRGMHHASWDVGSVQEVGLGGAYMARNGFDRGWGLGRHVLGANYFWYIRDPWGSYCEYSADIDYIPHDVNWASGDHAPEDAMFLWGPPPPEEFIQNFEPAGAA
jgi:catechol 2,3-dioxygenase-like lactoylglutathione lyase family enzyme